VGGVGGGPFNIKEEKATENRLRHVWIVVLLATLCLTFLPKVKFFNSND
jgi:hypothetical protein